jgi:hypothetical protein
MITHWIPYATAWGILALATLFLILYRHLVSSREDDSLHLAGTASADQLLLARRLAVIDRWGKLITAVTLLYGLALLILYFWGVWKDVPTY